MSLILPSSATPSQPANAPPKATARSEESASNAPGSFGDALSRSLAPAEEAEETVDKAATPLPRRRQPDAQQTDSPDLVNAMALSLAPLESRVTNAAPTGAVGSTANNSVQGAATASLTVTMASTVTSAEVTIAGTKVSPDANGQATPAASTLAPPLAAASPKDAGQASPKIRINAVALPASDSSATALVHGEIAARTSAPITTPDSEQLAHDGKVTPKSNPRTDASAAPPMPETAAPGKAATQTPDAGAASSSTGAALPGALATAAAPGPASVASPSAPLPMNAASLSPEVGSSEWGKALGQQVIQMGHAGHQVAELQLNPPGLGPLKVTLSMSDQQIQVLFVSAHSSVRAAVEAALPQLRTSLADSGINLGNTSVSADGQQQAAFSQRQGRQDEQRSYRSNARLDPQALSTRPVPEPLQPRHAMRVDTYA